MSAAHVHLMLNHVPVVLLATGAAFLAWALVRGSDELLRAGAALLVAAAVAGAPVFLTGEPAEELVEHRPGVSEAAIERHEEAAEAAIVVLGAVGVVALGGLFAFRRRRIPAWFGYAGLTLALLGAGVLARTATLGGQIVHAELRDGAGSAAGAARHD